QRRWRSPQEARTRQIQAGQIESRQDATTPRQSPPPHSGRETPGQLAPLEQYGSDGPHLTASAQKGGNHAHPDEISGLVGQFGDRFLRIRTRTGLLTFWRSG